MERNATDHVAAQEHIYHKVANRCLRLCHVMRGQTCTVITLQANIEQNEFKGIECKCMAPAISQQLLDNADCFKCLRCDWL